MADIDPITREALRRASQLKNHAAKTSPPPTDNRRQNPPKPHDEKPCEDKQPEPPRSPSRGFGLDALFRDKETSVIMILILLLMGEKGSEHLLLALIYLLI